MQNPGRTPAGDLRRVQAQRIGPGLQQPGHPACVLPAGIVDVEGTFERGDIIAIAGPDGDVFAWGLANYPRADVVAIRGRRSAEVGGLLGYEYGPEVVHRNDMALVEGFGMSTEKEDDDR